VHSEHVTVATSFILLLIILSFFQTLRPEWVWDYWLLEPYRKTFRDGSDELCFTGWTWSFCIVTFPESILIARFVIPIVPIVDLIYYTIAPAHIHVMLPSLWSGAGADKHLRLLRSRLSPGMNADCNLSHWIQKTMSVCVGVFVV